MIHRTRKIVLVNSCRLIFSGLPEEMRKQGTSITGNKALAQVIINRCESIAKNPDEFKYMIDTISVMMKGIDKQGIILPN